MTPTATLPIVCPGVESSGDPSETTFIDEPYDEYFGGLFLIDRFALTDRLDLEGQIRGDYHTENREDWSASASAIYSLDPDKYHNLRFSAAKAFRVPSIAIRKTVKSSLGGLFNVLPLQENFRNEQIWSLEAGYTGKFHKNITLHLNSYFQRLVDMLGPVNTIVGPVTNSIFDNVGDADAYGAEAELTYEHQKGKLSAWYAYNILKTQRYGQGIRAIWPAQNKYGLTGRLYLPHGWTLNTNYTSHSSIPAYENLILDLSEFHRLDLTLAKKIADGKGEIMFGIADLLNETNQPNLDIGEFAGHETPGRSFFARLQFNF